MKGTGRFDPARRFLDWINWRDASDEDVDGQFLRMVLLCLPDGPMPGVAEIVVNQLQDQARALQLSLKWKAHAPAESIRAVMHRTIDSIEARCRSR